MLTTYLLVCNIAAIALFQRTMLAILKTLPGALHNV